MYGGHPWSDNELQRSIRCSHSVWFGCASRMRLCPASCGNRRRRLRV